MIYITPPARRLAAAIRANKARMSAVLNEFEARGDRGPAATAACRAQVAALVAEFHDLRRLQDDLTPERLRAEREIAAFAAALVPCPDVVAVMTARG